MTIAATASEIEYDGDGVTVNFPIPFAFDTAADLKVTQRVKATGVVTTLTTGFSVSGGNGSTGTLSFLTAPASTVAITILDNPALTQTADYTANDPFPAETHERALDRQARISKRLYQTIQHALRVDDGDVSAGAGMLLPAVATRAGKFLRFDDDGNPEMADFDGDGTVLSQSIIAALLSPQTEGESGAGNVPANYAYGARNGYDVFRAGATGDGNADDTAELIKAFASSKRIYLEEGKTFLISATIPVQSGTVVYGGGKIKVGNGYNFIPFNLTGLSDVHFEGIEAESGTLGVSYSSAVAAFILFGSGATRCSASRIKVTGFQKAIDFYECIDCWVDSPNVINPIGWGINIRRGCNGVTVRNFRVSGAVNEHGVYISGGSGAESQKARNIQLIGGRISGCAIDGLKTTHCQDVQLDDVISYDNGGQNFYITQGSVRVQGKNLRATEAGENGYLFYNAPIAIASITQANPCVVETTGNHNLGTDEILYLASIGGMTELNGNDYKITVLSATTFSLATVAGVAVDSSGYGAFTSGGNAYLIVEDCQFQQLGARLNDKNGIVTSNAVRRCSFSDVRLDDNDQEASGSQYGYVATGVGNVGNKLESGTVSREVIGVSIASGVVDHEIGQLSYPTAAALANTTNISDSGTNTKIRHVTEGVTSVADGGTIAHGHPKTPTRVQLTPVTAGEMATVTTLGATTITVALKKHDNSAGTTQNVHWRVAG